MKKKNKVDIQYIKENKTPSFKKIKASSLSFQSSKENMKPQTFYKLYRTLRTFKVKFKIQKYKLEALMSIKITKNTCMEPKS